MASRSQSTTLVMARLQEHMLEGGPPSRARPCRASRRLPAHLGADLGCGLLEGMRNSCNFSAAQIEALQDTARAYPGHRMRADIAKMMRPAGQIDSRAACVAVRRRDIANLDLSRDFFADAVWHAREIRNRYTFLDLAADSRRLAPEKLIER